MIYSIFRKAKAFLLNLVYANRISTDESLYNEVIEYINHLESLIDHHLSRGNRIEIMEIQAELDAINSELNMV